MANSRAEPARRETIGIVNTALDVLGEIGEGRRLMRCRLLALMIASKEGVPLDKMAK